MTCASTTKELTSVLQEVGVLAFLDQERVR
jgi:hypothetical protein